MYFFLLVGETLSCLSLGCAVLQVSPVVKTPIYRDVVKECKCDLDEFVVVGKVWEFISCDWVPVAWALPHILTWITRNTAVLWHSEKLLPKSDYVPDMKK